MIDSILILAAGKGERLKKLTESTPKPLLKIDNKDTTILDRLIHQCVREFPETPIHVNISYLADQFLQHFSSVSKEFTPIFLFEKKVLGPARTLLEFQKFGNYKTLVIHGDLVLADLEFTKLARQIRDSDHQIIVSHLRLGLRARSKLNASNDRVESIEEFDLKLAPNKPEDVVSVCSGIYTIFAKSILGYDSKLGESLAPKLLNISVQNQETREFHWRDWRFAVDSPEIYLEAKDKLLTQN
jgi:NDP-sugar pyrophosphorylase family protein